MRLRGGCDPSVSTAILRPASLLCQTRQAQRKKCGSLISRLASLSREDSFMSGRRRIIQPARVPWNRPSKALTLFVVLTAVVLSACGDEEGDGKAPSKPGPPAAAVVVAPVVQKSVPIYTELTARTDATD